MNNKPMTPERIKALFVRFMTRRLAEQSPFAPIAPTLMPAAERFSRCSCGKVAAAELVAAFEDDFFKLHHTNNH